MEAADAAKVVRLAAIMTVTTRHPGVLGRLFNKFMSILLDPKIFTALLGNESDLPAASPGRDGHRQFQPDVVRGRANKELITPGFNDILFLLRVPVAQARGGNLDRDLG